MWLAGNPGPPPSPATIMLIFVVVALGLAVAVAAALPRRNREAPLREKTGARQAVAFEAPVRVLSGGAGLPMAQRGSFRLVVRGDLIEVANSIRPARLLGQQYCYRAPDTTVKVVAGFRHHWIEIDGQPPRSAASSGSGSRTGPPAPVRADQRRRAPDRPASAPVTGTARPASAP
jgi:hypothetical protein